MSLLSCVAVMAATSFGLFNRASCKGVKYLCSLSYKQRNIGVVRSVFLSENKATNRVTF